MGAIAEHSGLSTLTGSPKEVRARLASSEADQVLVLAFDRLDPGAFQTFANNVTQVAASLGELLLEAQSEASLKRLAEMLMPPKPASPRLLKEAAMLVRARKAVLESGDWLTAAELAQLAGLSSRNPSAQPNKWKKGGQIFAIPHGGVDYFPGYGLDPHNDFRPLKALGQIIDVFDGHKDGWGMAYWFRSANSFLNGKRPQDLLASSPDQVIEAAHDEIQEVAHG
ncbi:MAG: hypothetical protein Q4D19_05410 [Lautropia sp.]|nr:hypothetical protein [Lautropia sp.]